MTSIKIVCTEPGAFHDRYGRTVVASFTQQFEGSEFVKVDVGRSIWRGAKWTEDKVARRGAVDREGSYSFRNDLGHPAMHRIKRPSTTRWNGNGPAEKRGVGFAHLDLKCRGCGLARRAKGATLWPIFDDFAAAGVERVELRMIVDALNRA